MRPGYPTVVSPVLCNVYLHRLDRAWDERDGLLARYGDDLIAICWSRSQAERALVRLTELLAELGLEPKMTKTRIVNLEVGGKGLDFLGFHHRVVRSPGRNGKRPVVFLARWPADKAMRHARDRIRHVTDRRRQLRPEAIAEEVSLFLRGWAAYFRYGHSAQRFGKIRTYAWTRLAHYISERHGRARGFGEWVLRDPKVNALGLISMYGIVVPPRPFKDWRVRPNAGGERRR